MIQSETYDDQIAKHSSWVGTPEAVRSQVAAYHEQVGGFDIASVNGLPHLLPLETAKRSLRCFAAEVMPAFSK
jgi:alkanesulfonate monooxygenase SsuD/methylene tetrahydromethanopterin reductase-like flavin-dependent oxidoreductase (luciferase family)